MDVVAGRAETSMRSLYAHLESKDKLFLAALDLVRELCLGWLKTPDASASDLAEVVSGRDGDQGEHRHHRSRR